MTREEFNNEMEAETKEQERINWLVYKSEQHLKQFRHNNMTYVSLKEAFDMVHEIHNDFESRICENCKYWTDSNNNMCIKFSMYADKNYGCNKFERKANE